MINGVHTLNVLTEVAGERAAQDERWGQQDHPVHVPGDETGFRVLGRPYRALARVLKERFASGQRSGAIILLEEVMEALEAETPRRQREELIQVAAVAVMMAEALDREDAKHHGPGCELEPFHAGDCGPSAVHRALAERGQDRIFNTFKAVSQDCPHCGNGYLADRLAGHIREAHPQAVVFPAPGLSSPLLVTIQMPHAYNGAGRLHGICRCGEGKDDPVHRPDPCPGCPHPAHDQVCMVQVSAGSRTFSEAEIECGCITGV